MVQIFGKVAKQLNDFWTNLDKTRRIQLIVVLSLLFFIAIALAFLLNHKEYTVLYSNLEEKDAGEILNKLEEMKIDAKPQGTGTILVPKDQESKIRMQLSAEGYPKSGLNYDLFMNQTGFGTTDYEKQKYLLFQLQDRLQNTIKTLDGVEDAIVTISMPEQDSFVLQEDKEPVTASVLLKLQTGVQLTSKQVQGIEELVTKSVLGLKSENVSIVDSNMVVLNGRKDEGGQLASTQLELENQVRDQIQAQILSMLEPVFGRGKVVAAANVKLDFDKKIQETVKYEPVVDDEGIATSIQELKEKVTNGTSGGVPGTTSNGGSAQYPAADNTNGNYEKVDKVTTYQVNQIKEQLEKAQGQIKELSVSVIIDNPNLTEDVKENVRQIVASTAGVDQANIVVQSMAFDGRRALQDQFTHKDQSKPASNLVNNILMYGLMAVLALVLLIILIRILKPRNISPADMWEQEMQPAPVAASVTDISIDTEEETSIRKQIERFVQKKPDIAAQLVRTWLNEE